MSINQRKLELLGIYEKDEKKPTDFEPFNQEDVINNAYLN